MFHSYTFWNRLKTCSFLTFWGGIEMEHCAKMGWENIFTSAKHFWFTFVFAIFFNHLRHEEGHRVIKTIIK